MASFFPFFDYLAPVLLGVYVLSFLKESFFASYVIQLKEYRRIKFQEYLRSKQGRYSFFGKKFLFRVLLLILYGLYSLFLIGYLRHDGVWLFLVLIRLLFEGYNSYLFVSNISKKRFWPAFTARYSILLTVFAVIRIACLVLSNVLNFLGYAILLSYLLVPVFLFLAVAILYPLEKHMTSRLVKKAQSIVKKSDFETIAISGSYGKSSVKNFLTALLNRHKTAICTDGNINTVKGVGRFVLDTFSKEKVANFFVCEMGGDTSGEIATIGNMMQHKIGILTGLNNQHAALYGGLRGAIKAETEIIEQLKNHHGRLYANMDNEYVRKCMFPDEVSVIGYSIDDEQADAYSRITSYDDGIWSFDFAYKDQSYSFQTDVLGEHNVLNLTGVIACCLDLGMEYDDLRTGLLDLRRHQKTLSTHAVGQSLLIDDRYNINIDGVYAGVKMIDSYDQFKNKIVLINEINELGKETKKTHFDLGALVARFSVDRVVLTGENYAHHIRDGLLANGLSDEKIVDCYEAGYTKSLELLSRLVEDEKTVVLFLGREQGSMKFFDRLSV